jgi:hypothetical protein
MAKINMQKSFNTLDQGPSQIISEFTKGFDTLVRSMRGVEILEMDGETSAIWFVEELHQVRHGAMVLYLTNGRADGQALTATVEEAYIIAKHWKSCSARVVDLCGIMADGAVFMLADEVRALAIIPSHIAPNQKPQPAGRDRALKPRRLTTDAAKQIREACQSAGTFVETKRN